MSYQVLARKWRPKSFHELTGQEHVSKTLENAIKARRIAQAYLFSGVRGVGKTTVARILAKSLNCIEGPTPAPCMKCQSCIEITGGFSVDVVEIDGASHTGVDNVRELQENAQYIPLRGHYKIYIIDEVHMLSTSAFNALLKILEEPPPHIVFIFATTEPHKIPSTIHSRCQHFQFRRISYKEIMERLRYILHEEGIDASEDTLSSLARASDGSMRDALSLLDQVIAYTGGNLTEGDVTWILGLADHMIGPFMQHIINKDSAKALSLLKDIVDGGYDLKQFCSNVVEHIRNLTLTRLGMGQEVIDLPLERIEDIAKVGKGISGGDLQRLFSIFSKALEEMRWFPYPRFSFEMAVIKATNMRPSASIDDLLGRLAQVEKRLSGGENPPPLTPHPALPHKEGGKKDEVIRALPQGGGKSRGIAMFPPPLMGGGEGEGEKKEGDKWGFSGETPMSQGLTKEHENPHPHPIPPPSRGREKGRGERDRVRVEGFSDEKGISNGSDLSVLWRNVVEKINESKPNWGSYLEQSMVIGYDNKILSIGFNGGASVFINLIERKECKDFILGVAKDYIPEVVEIKFIATPNKEGHSPAYNEHLSHTHDKLQQEVEEAFSEPILQEVINIFGGELIEVRRKKGE